MTPALPDGSPRPRLALVDDPAQGLTLLLDEAVQFTAAQEHRYHEALAVVPMLFGPARRVFIGGGGDGLALARILRFPEVQRVVVCDHDPAVTELARTHPGLRALNGDAFADPRVTLVHADAKAWLAASEERFELLIADFPDPVEPALAALYMPEVYRLFRGCMAEGGRLVVQTTSLPGVGEHVLGAVSTVFPVVCTYQVRYQPAGTTEFILAADEPLVQRRPTPAWTRHLNDVGALFARARDEAFVARPPVDAATLAALTLDVAWRPALVRPSPYHPAWGELALPPATPVPARLVPAFLAAQAAAGRPVAALLRGAEGQRYTKGLRAAGYRPGPPLEHVAIDFDDPLRAEHRALFARLDDGRLNTIEIVQGPPGDHPDAARLLTAYLTAHPDHVLGAVDVAFALAQPRTCLLARDADGDARALVVLTLGPRVMLDVLYGCGSPRQHVLAVLLALRTIDREFDRDVDFFPMSPQVAALARRLGGRTRTRVEAWLPG